LRDRRDPSWYNKEYIERHRIKMDETDNETGRWGKPVEDSDSQATPEQALTAGQIPDAEIPAELPEFTMNDLPEALRAGFARQGWTSLMPVQARAIPYILASRDYDDPIAHRQRQDRRLPGAHPAAHPARAQCYPGPGAWCPPASWPCRLPKKPRYSAVN
jgi:hypothetical protein